MKEYSINEVSKQLGMPKATLRYYDQMGIISPKRAENDYRFYTEQDILDLRYVEVMKFSGFALLEIRQVMAFKKEHNKKNFPVLMQMIDGKQAELLKKIELFRLMIRCLDEIEKAILSKKSIEDIVVVDEMICKIFQNMKADRA